MLGAMKLENRRVIAIRNVHRAFLNACALLDLDVEWIMPDYTSGILSGVINPDDVEAALAKFPHSCLYVTSPDYTGRTADIATLAALCRKYDSLLIVDNAHGAHLRFLPRNLHPIFLGADMCCDSAHKMLPALTGAAMLHVKDKKYKPILKQTMSMFTSTSPSYLIMMSLDLCNKYINERIRRDIAANLIHIHNFRVNFVERLIFAESEPFHITIKAAESGYNGNELAEMLRRNGAECEYSDRDTVILLMSPANKAEDYKKLTNALENALDSLSKADLKPVYIPPVLPEKVMSIRNAAFSPCEEIPVAEAEGRICAAVKVPCPPAVPIAASGEIIDRNCIKIFKSYSISSVIVVK
jgi:arginine/lysine/ornithine decarboxylase